MNIGNLFENFVNAPTLKSTKLAFYQLCVALEVDPSDGLSLYRRLRQFKDWRAEKLWKLLDKRVERPEYLNQRACNKLKVLIIGAGPCGLRTAIECALLGARVVVLEQREKFSRNNVLHLWEFVIHDLKCLGAKVFYPKFCTGSIEHISIRTLQCILLKVSLCFGVQVYEGVSFKELVFPTEEDGGIRGFRANLEPREHILSSYEFDILIGADGKKNSVPGFQRDEMRGKLAIAITANFVNNRTHAEERVPEISGVSYIFNQTFFKEMYATTGVDLENIVYYKDETHYFVMCAKKQSLLDAGVIIKDFEDVHKLLNVDNVDHAALCNYSRAAAEFATNGKLPSLDFAKNHRGLEDIAVFDFTSLFSSKNSVRLVERLGKRLIMGIVGDTLHEPFWPTGSGCARGFLGVFDTAWLIRHYGLNKKGPLEIISERESTYRLLAQVTKDNMNKMFNKYSIDPKTRYVSLELSIDPADVVDLVNSDNPRTINVSEPLPLNNSDSVHSFTSSEMQQYSIWNFLHYTLLSFNVNVINLTTSFEDGSCLAALISKFYPDLLDFNAFVADKDDVGKIEKLFATLRSTIGVDVPCAAMEWKMADDTLKISYVSTVVNILRDNTDNVLKSIISPRAFTQKRKAQNPLRITRRKTQPIEFLTLSLMNNQSTTGTSSNDKISGQVEMDATSRGFSNRPPVEKLNPTLINRVDKLVTGTFTKEQECFKTERSVSKIDKLHIERIEQKLQDGPISLARTENLSSQDEMIMRLAAADARKEAIAGFTKDAATSKFKKYDDVIKKSENMLKEMDVVGIDPFQRHSAQMCDFKSEEDGPVDVSVKSSGHVTPIDSVIFRSRVPIAAVAPKRHSVPLPGRDLSSANDSLNTRKQNDCEICKKVVYLAERMQVESFYIHKNCFRCAYCNQPLRLGDYGKDKDLEYHHKNRFYCNIHLKISLREKLDRIKRIHQKRISAMYRANSVGSEVPSTPIEINSKTSHVSQLGFYSPELMEKNINEVSPVINVRTFTDGGICLPSKSSAAIRQRIHSEDSVDEDEQFFTPSKNSAKDVDEDSLSECEVLEEADLTELETTIIEIADQQPEKPLTDEQVIAVIGRLNQRRCGQSPDDPMIRSPLTALNSMDETVYYTPEYDVKPRANTTSSCIETENYEDDIRQRKHLELQKLRTEYKLRAQQKTDEELGLENVSTTPQKLPSKNVASDCSASGSLPNASSQETSVSQQEICVTPVRSTGMLSQLFSPGKLKNPSASNKEVHSESKKETSILGSAFRRLRLKRSESPQLTIDSECVPPMPNAAQSRVAAVAPSPRLPSGREELSPTIHITVNEKNLRMFHKKAEKIIRQHKENMPRTAQELERLIQQNEFRLQTIAQAGSKCENLLRKDPCNRCELECWLALVREHEVLRNVDTDNRNRLRKLELQMKYRELNLRYANLDGKMADRELLSEMLNVVNEREKLDKDLDGFTQLSLKRYTSIGDTLARHKFDYRNFDPLFV